MRLHKKYEEIKKNETKYEKLETDDAEIILTAYGTTSRIVSNAIRSLRKEGIKAGIIRPITLWPFPYKAYEEAADRTKAFLTVEMSMGQMIEDVKLGVNGKKPVYFCGRTGGMIPDSSDIVEKAKKILGGEIQ